MITTQNLNNLVDKLAEIAKLGLQYNLDDIVLGKHSYRPKERLYFVLSRKGKVLTLREGADIHVALCDLLGAERYKEEDDVAVEIKEIFNPGCFEDDYGQRISLLEHTDTAKEKVVTFIRNHLDFSEFMSVASLSQKRKRGSSSEAFMSLTPPSVNDDDTDVESSLRKQRTLELDLLQNQGFSEEKKSRVPSPLSLRQPSSGALFASTGRQEIVLVNALSPELQELAQTVIEKMRKNPQCADAMLAFIRERFANTKQLIHS